METPNSRIDLHYAEKPFQEQSDNNNDLHVIFDRFGLRHPKKDEIEFFIKHTCSTSCNCDKSILCTHVRNKLEEVIPKTIALYKTLWNKKCLHLIDSETAEKRLKSVVHYGNTFILRLGTKAIDQLHVSSTHDTKTLNELIKNVPIGVRERTLKTQVVHAGHKHGQDEIESTNSLKEFIKNAPQYYERLIPTEGEPRFTTEWLEDLSCLEPSSSDDYTIPVSTAFTQSNPSQVMQHLIASFEKFREKLEISDMPDAIEMKTKEKILDAIRRVQLKVLPEGEFDRCFLRGTFEIGTSLLEALRHWNSRKGDVNEELASFIQLFVLHECYHFFKQGLGSYHDEIGRTDGVLEAMDFEADGFAIFTAISCALRLKRNDKQFKTEGDLINHLARHYSNVELHALLTFDRASLKASNSKKKQQDFFVSEPTAQNQAKLSRRRLQRYLIWILQIARAERIFTGEHLRLLLFNRVHISLSPLNMFVGEKREDLVESACEKTSYSLYMPLPSTGRLVRVFGKPGERGFNPGELLQLLQDIVLNSEIDWEAVWKKMDQIDRMMRCLIDDHRFLVFQE